MERSGRKSRWWKRSAVGAATLALSIVLLEIAFRLWVPPKELPPVRLQFANQLQGSARDLESIFAPSDSRFWSLRPGAVDPTGRDRIGTRGLRGPEPAPPDWGGLRIAVLGDSCTYGVLTPLEQTYGARLEQRLRALHPERAFEVLNGGVPGYTLFQGLRLFEELLAPLPPDLLVLYHGVWNDFSPAMGASDRARSENGAPPPTRFERVYRSLSGLRSVQWLGSRYAGTLRYRHLRSVRDAWMDGEPPEGYRVALPEFERCLALLLDRCAELGTDVLVILPELNVSIAEKGSAHLPRLEAYRGALAAAAQERGLPTVDLRELFPRERHAELFTDTVHPSPLGYLWLGLELADVLRAHPRFVAAPRVTDSPRPSSLSCDEDSLDSEAGGWLRLRIDLGVESAGRSARLHVGRTPSRRPGRPFEPDDLGTRSSPPLPHPLRLDASGRASVSLEFPGGRPELANERALGFAVEVSSESGSTWSEVLWLPLEKAG